MFCQASPTRLIRPLTILASGVTGYTLSTFFSRPALHRSVVCEEIPERTSPHTSILPLSFKGTLIYKLSTLDFTELQRPEVLIEIGLVSLPLLIGGITSYRIMHGKRMSWNRGHFFNILNVSLNFVRRVPIVCPETHQVTGISYQLSFRTLMETELSNVVTNEVGCAMLMKQAKLTSEKGANNAIIEFADYKTQFMVSNQISNQISAMCASAFLHRDIMWHEFMKNKQDSHQNADGLVWSSDFLKKETVGVKYVMALTCEPEIAVKRRKIRVILIQRRMIEQLRRDFAVYGESSAILEHKSHAPRWELLKQIVRVYDKQVDERGILVNWGKPLSCLELCTVRVSDKVGEVQEGKLK